MQQKRQSGHVQPKDFPKDAQVVQGFWVGSSGGGQVDGVTFLPDISELKGRFPAISSSKPAAHPGPTH
jgi:hypothetical protein